MVNHQWQNSIKGALSDGNPAFNRARWVGNRHKQPCVRFDRHIIEISHGALKLHIIHWEGGQRMRWFVDKWRKCGYFCQWTGELVYTDALYLVCVFDNTSLNIINIRNFSTRRLTRRSNLNIGQLLINLLNSASFGQKSALAIQMCTISQNKAIDRLNFQIVRQTFVAVIR